jgi:hypothetical protein
LVACHSGTCLWVLPGGGMNDQALFTRGALDLATGKLRTPQRTVVRAYKGEPKPKNLTETKATTTEDDESGTANPWRMEGKLSGRHETFQAQDTDARGTWCYPWTSLLPSMHQRCADRPR